MNAEEKTDEIIDVLAEFNYYYPDGKPILRVEWESLDDEGKKPYRDVARLQVLNLKSRVWLKTERELPFTGTSDGTWLLWAAIQKDKMLEAGYQPVDELEVE